MTEKGDGIVFPPIDSVLDKVDSNYQLVIFASKRARQINEYYSALHEEACSTTWVHWLTLQLTTKH